MARKTKIKSGETLSGIASREKTSIPELLKLNPTIKNPNVIFSGADLNLPGTSAGSTQTTIPTTGQTTIGSAGEQTKTETSPITSVIDEKAGVTKTGRETILDRLTEGLKTSGEFKPATRRAELETERGLGEQRETIGGFESEISKTLGFLDTLEADIKERTGEFLVPEASRRRLLASERAPLTKELGTLERGLGTAESRLAREESTIADILGFEQAEARAPLEGLLTETQLRSQIDELFPDQKIDSVASIAGAIEEIGEDPLEIFNTLQEQGITDVGINEIVETIEKLQSLTPEIETGVEEAGGRKLLINLQTGETIKDLGAADVEAGTGVGPGGEVDPTIQAWVNRIGSGSAKITNVPQAIRSTVVKQLDAQGIEELTDTQRNTIQALSVATSIVGELNSKFAELESKFATTPFGRLTEGGSLAISSFLQTDTDAAAFQSFKEGILATLARATGEKGVLTNQDVGRARALIPKLTDTKDVAETKLRDIEALFQEFNDRAIGTFTQTFKKEEGGDLTSGKTSSGIQFTVEN